MEKKTDCKISEDKNEQTANMQEHETEKKPDTSYKMM